MSLKPHTPLSNLHLTILEKFGIEQKSFGTGSAASTGAITEV